MHDVIVVGGSFNGLAVALALGGYRSRTPLDVAVIDAIDLSRPLGAESDRRGSAITAASRGYLEAVGAWDQLAPFAAEMRQIDVVDDSLEDTARPALLRFGNEAETASAHIVENHHLHHVIREAVDKSDRISLHSGLTVNGIERDRGGATLSLSDGSLRRARLVIAADGRKSPLRSMVGIDTLGWDYRQVGIVLTVEHELPHHGRAEEHFLSAGPFATLPLTGSRSSIVWTQTPEEGQRIMALPNDILGEELKRHLNPRLGRLLSWTPPQSWPLTLLLARQFVSDRVALVGDAAHVVHPLAGLGFNLGLKDTAALAEVVLLAARDGQDFGGRTVLDDYETWRRADTFAVAAMTDVLNRLFSSDITALKLVRDLGLGVVNRIPLLKTALVREAAGLSGSLPRLLAGQPI